MGFTYNPEDASKAWPDGDYDAEIVTVEETTSKSSGADMLKLGIRVYNQAGKDQTINDYIVVPSGLFKLKQIAQAFGQGKEFDAGRFDHLGIKGRRLTVTLEKQSSDEYGDQNRVKKYHGSKSAIGGAATTTRSSPMVNAIRERAKANAAAVAAHSPLDGEQSFKDEDVPF